MKHMTFKYLLFCSVIALLMASCKPEAEKSDESTAHADSLMKALNSPELKAISKKILASPDNGDR